MPITLPRQSTLVSIYDVVVTFDPVTNSLTFGGDMPADRQLYIGQGVNLIVFNLQTSGVPPTDPQAVFVADPIEWIDQSRLPFAQGQRFNDQRYTLVVYNTALESLNNTHQFNVAVEWGGVVHRSDPTIINEPPGGG